MSTCIDVQMFIPFSEKIQANYWTPECIAIWIIIFGVNCQWKMAATRNCVYNTRNPAWLLLKNNIIIIIKNGRIMLWDLQAHKHGFNWTRRKTPFLEVGDPSCQARKQEDRTRI